MTLISTEAQQPSELQTQSCLFASGHRELEGVGVLCGKTNELMESELNDSKLHGPTPCSASSLVHCKYSQMILRWWMILVRAWQQTPSTTWKSNSRIPPTVIVSSSFYNKYSFITMSLLSSFCLDGRPCKMNADKKSQEFPSGNGACCCSFPQ